jgi:hypothetical protein
LWTWEREAWKMLPLTPAPAKKAITSECVIFLPFPLLQLRSHHHWLPLKHDAKHHGSVVGGSVHYMSGLIREGIDARARLLSMKAHRDLLGPKTPVCVFLSHLSRHQNTRQAYCLCVCSALMWHKHSKISPSA